MRTERPFPGEAFVPNFGYTAGGWRMLVVALALLGCGVSVPTEETVEAADAGPPNAVQALAKHLGIKRPIVDAEDPEVRVRIFDKDGKVVSTHAMPRQQARTYWRQLRHALEGRTTSLPAPAEDSPRTGGDLGPPSAAFVDTTTTFEIYGVEYTFQSATTTSEVLAATTHGASIPSAADWATYSRVGDSTIVTSAASQVYDAGILELEVYFSPAAIQQLNAELNEPETAPPIYPEGSCLGAALELAGSVILAGAASLAFAANPNPITWLGMWGARLIAFGALINYLCECRNKCAEEAPPLTPIRGFQ